jgi:hypothetical protein
VLAGNGGNATPYSGGGGGGGGALTVIYADGSAFTRDAGDGGNGAAGAVYIWYVG